jgi:putative FmdB family regulatory protein
MPTYEYACKACGEHLEVVQSFKDDPLTACPKCGGELRKVFGAIGIAFKGSGFYRNDSRPESKESKGSKKEKDGGEGGSKEKEKEKEKVDSKSDSSGSSGDASSGKSGDKPATSDKSDKSARSDSKSAASS